MNTESIGQILLRETELTPEQLDLALREQQKRRPLAELGQILLEKEFITTMQLYQCLALQWNIPYLEKISPKQLKSELVKEFPLDFLKKHHLLPVIDKHNQISIAMDDPLNVEAYDAVLNLLGRHCPRIICPPAEIEQAISRCYYHGLGRQTEDQTRDEESSPQDSNAVIAQAPQEDLSNIASQGPIVKLVNTILFRAAGRRASDIHIEPYQDEVKVRFRIDGVLHDVLTLPKGQALTLVSRLKIMANLNIAERRLPQDGQTRIKLGEKEMDLRVSIIPVAGGERVVLRLLDKGGPGLTMENLGFTPEISKTFSRLINAPHGIILLTGPTGSGKTTSLYCAINTLNTQERNILTVEDPIEYQLPGVGQMQVKPQINLTFTNSLRHILRQDPDVIMIGEIRDVETAEIAIHASLTGHLVLSTLHTNDSASAVTRLIDMGIEPYLISSSLTAVMAQRLLRVICPNCKVPCKTEIDVQNIMNLPADVSALAKQCYTGTGCPHCMETGYFGRTGVFELLTIDDEMKELIIAQTPGHAIKDAAIRKGMRTLRDDGMRQVLAGVTTVEEVLRVTQDNSDATDKSITEPTAIYNGAQHE